MEKATLASGCFWCVEAVFQNLEGVENVESGFSGGHVKNPSYREVCEGRTGHAEAVHITFDPAVISFAKLLELFWNTHDPTTLNRQGNDVGEHYRSAIFFHSEEQRSKAEKSKEAAASLFTKPIVTEITAFTSFYKAENYHQDYFNLNETQPYCSMVIAPKVTKFKNKYGDLLKS